MIKRKNDPKQGKPEIKLSTKEKKSVGESSSMIGRGIATSNAAFSPVAAPATIPKRADPSSVAGGKRITPVVAERQDYLAEDYDNDRGLRCRKRRADSDDDGEEDDDEELSSEHSFTHSNGPGMTYDDTAFEDEANGSDERGILRSASEDEQREDMAETIRALSEQVDFLRGQLTMNSSRSSSNLGPIFNVAHQFQPPIVITKGNVRDWKAFAALEQYIKNSRANNVEVKRSSFIESGAFVQIKFLLGAYWKHEKNGFAIAQHHDKLPDEKFFRAMQSALEKTGSYLVSDVKAFTDIPCQMQLTGRDTIIDWCTAVEELAELRDVPLDGTTESCRAIVRALIAEIRAKNSDKRRCQDILYTEVKTRNPMTIGDLLHYVNERNAVHRETVMLSHRLEGRCDDSASKPPGGGSKKMYKGKPWPKKPRTDAGENAGGVSNLHSLNATSGAGSGTGPQKATPKEYCNCCGKPKHEGSDSCPHKGKPGTNNATTTPWRESSVSKTWAKAGFKSFQPTQSWDEIKATASKKGMLSHIDNCGDCDYNTTVFFNPKPIIFGDIQIQGNERLSVTTLIDTGAIDSDYISPATAERLETLGAARRMRKSCLVCSLKNICTQCLGRFEIDYKFFNELTNSDEIIPLLVDVADIAYDLIIGSTSSNYFGLLHKLSSLFPKPAELMTISSTSMQNYVRPDQAGENVFPTEDVVPVEDSISRTYLYAAYEFADEIVEPNMDNYRAFDEKIHISEILGQPEAVPEISTPEKSWRAEPADGLPPVTTPSISLPEGAPQINLYGPLELQHKLLDLCTEYSDVFSKELQPDPADVGEMKLRVDEEAWKKGHTDKGARRQSPAKEQEIAKQVQSLLDNGMIRPSSAPAFSQCLLAPKPGGDWRLVVDYRRLNEVSESIYKHPIPNIPQMLRRIGDQKPKYFGIFDLTKGFHQCLLAEASRWLTAFVACFLGIFEWIRVPMGIKDAPSFFQHAMATVVLIGLIHAICELYIDDCITWGISDEEYLDRLRNIFERFRKYRVTVNPKKTHLGLSRIEYVGHVLDHEGITFSDKKIREVLDFPLPKTQSQLKSFLGLVNYMRENLRNLSTVAHPLFEMTQNYRKNRLLQWTPEREAAFLDVKQLVQDLPKLFYSDPDGQIIMYTDASDYGVGAYLCQLRLVDGKYVEEVIQIMSMSLVGPQLNWHTYDKEAYAIFAAFVKFEYLLRDVHFVLKTDHRNLTFIASNGNKRVQRWRTFLQEFDCDVEHIAGELNVVADALSRCCENLTENESHCLQQLQANYVADAHGNMQPDIPAEILAGLRKCHNSIIGHHGVNRTLDRLQQYCETHAILFRAGQFRAYCRTFIRECSACQKMSYLTPSITTAPFVVNALRPMQKVMVDTLHMSNPDKYGYVYIVAVIDAFSRFIELYALKDIEATSIAKILLQHAGRYGFFDALVSDRGTEFANAVIQSMLLHMGTEHSLTIAASKEENEIVERSHKETLRFLKGIVYDKNVLTDWSDNLPLVQRIMNAAVHSSLGTSPAKLIFGNSIDLDRGIFIPFAPAGDAEEIRLSEWTARMLVNQHHVLAAAQRAQMTANERHLATADPNILPTEYADNSYVLLSYTNDSGVFRKGPSNKLQTFLKGPYLVVNHDRQRGSYTLRDLISHSLETVHVSKLRPYVYNPDRQQPPEVVASKDRQLDFVAAVLSHTGDKRNKTRMRFRVHWTDGSVTIEPWNHLQSNELLHEYLIANRMKSLIPPNYCNVNAANRPEHNRRRARNL
jgi:transposase InsO family protein